MLPLNVKWPRALSIYLFMPNCGQQNPPLVVMNERSYKLRPFRWVHVVYWSICVRYSPFVASSYEQFWGELTYVAAIKPFLSYRIYMFRLCAVSIVPHWRYWLRNKEIKKKKLQSGFSFRFLECSKWKVHCVCPCYYNQVDFIRSERPNEALDTRSPLESNAAKSQTALVHCLYKTATRNIALDNCLRTPAVLYLSEGWWEHRFARLVITSVATSPRLWARRHTKRSLPSLPRYCYARVASGV